MARTGPQRMSALVVEDDCRRGDLGAVMLGEFDLDVERVRSPEAAIAHMTERGSDVGVVLVGDCNGIGSAGLARRIGVLWPSVSVILTSDVPAGESLPASATRLPASWKPLDIVSIVERAARADHSIRAVAL